MGKVKFYLETDIIRNKVAPFHDQVDQ